MVKLVMVMLLLRLRLRSTSNLLRSGLRKMLLGWSLGDGDTKTRQRLRSRLGRRRWRLQRLLLLHLGRGRFALMVHPASSRSRRSNREVGRIVVSLSSTADCRLGGLWPFLASETLVVCVLDYGLPLGLSLIFLPNKVVFDLFA